MRELHGFTSLPRKNFAGRQLYRAHVIQRKLCFYCPNRYRATTDLFLLYTDYNPGLKPHFFRNNYVKSSKQSAFGRCNCNNSYLGLFTYSQWHYAEVSEMIVSYFSQAQLLTRDSEQTDLICLFSAVAAKEPQLGASL